MSHWVMKVMNVRHNKQSHEVVKQQKAKQWQGSSVRFVKKMFNTKKINISVSKLFVCTCLLCVKSRINLIAVWDAGMFNGWCYGSRLTSVMRTRLKISMEIMCQKADINNDAAYQWWYLLILCDNSLPVMLQKIWTWIDVKWSVSYNYFLQT